MIGALLLLITAFALILFGQRQAHSPSSSEISKQVTDQNSEEPVFDKTKHSLADPASIWVVVNKQRPLPQDYEPGQLVTPNVPLTGAVGTDNMSVSSVAAGPLEQLVAAAKTAGHSLVLVSGYRSYATQASVYNGYVNRDGQAVAETYSARPGYSEHQTGLVVDLGRADGTCQLDECFGATPEGQWLAAHAHEYGFIIRYEQGRQAVTGYDYEPWHIRYFGKELAAELHKQKTTPEEFFGLGAAATY